MSERLAYRAKQYAKYLYKISDEHEVTTGNAVAMGHALPFDEWRKKEFGECGTERRRQQRKEKAAALKKHLSKPLSQRISESALSEVALLLRQVADGKQKEKDEIEEFLKLQQQEEIGFGVFS